MTPQETAQELVKKMYGNIFDGGQYEDAEESWYKAKQCALIAVDEKYTGIINVIVDLKGRGCIDDKTFLKALDDMNTEWEQVKEELCKH